MSEEKFIIKDSGQRAKFDSGMVRDVDTGKRDYYRVTEGPMLDRWAEHLTKGAVKYPDVSLGRANWTLAEGAAELIRFKKSAARHFFQWLRGEKDEDHAAAIYFNINGAEYVKGKLNERGDDGQLELQLRQSVINAQESKALKTLSQSSGKDSEQEEGAEEGIKRPYRGESSEVATRLQEVSPGLPAARSGWSY